MGLLNTWDEVVTNHPVIGQIGDLIQLPTSPSLNVSASGSSSPSISSTKKTGSGILSILGNAVTGLLGNSESKAFDLNKVVTLPTVSMSMDKETKNYFTVALVAGAGLVLYLFTRRRR